MSERPVHDAVHRSRVVLYDRLLRLVGRVVLPITVPSTPPAAAPITALFTLRPVAAPRIAPVATPMMALCTPIELRRRVPGAGEGSSAGGTGREVATTSPPDVAAPVVSPTSVDVVRASLALSDRTEPLGTTPGDSVTRFVELEELGFRSGALATTRAAGVGPPLAERGVIDRERPATRCRASVDSAAVGANAR